MIQTRDICKGVSMVDNDFEYAYNFRPYQKSTVYPVVTFFDIKSTVCGFISETGLGNLSSTSRNKTAIIYTYICVKIVKQIWSLPSDWREQIILLLSSGISKYRIILSYQDGNEESQDAISLSLS